MKKFVLLTLLLTILPMGSCYSFSNNYTWSVVDNTIETSLSTSTELEQNNFLNLESASAILIEQNSGQILYSHNIHEKLHPASVTKVMSLLLIMEALDSGKITLDTYIPCSSNAASMGGSQIWLDTTESLTVHEMLKAISVVSANDYKVQLRHKNF